MNKDVSPDRGFAACKGSIFSIGANILIKDT